MSAKWNRDDGGGASGSCVGVSELRCVGALATPAPFQNQQSLWQHSNRCHKGIKGDESSMGRALKRKRDSQAIEESDKRRRLEEARIAASAACRTPELVLV